MTAIDRHRDPPRERRPARTGDSASPPKGVRERDDRKARLLKQASASIVASIADAIAIKHGEPFFLCPPDGQLPIDGGHGYGLYHHDMRFLSGYEMRIGGVRPSPLAAVAPTGARATLELTLPRLELDTGVLGKERLGVQWTRSLDLEPSRLVDRIRFRSFTADATTIPVRFDFEADFVDVFTVRGLLPQRPGVIRDPTWDSGRLVFRYDGEDGVIRTLTVAFRPSVTDRDGTSARFSIDLPPRDERSLEVELAIGEELRPGVRPIERRARLGREHVEEPRDERTRAGGHPWKATVQSDAVSLDAALERSFDDLLTLRDDLDGQRYYAAGVPWFSTLFGRDALIAAYQTLAFDADIAAETLRVLASRQGTRQDQWRDEEPGKMLHELRVGELARLEEIPHTPYYGSIDSTPLFLLLLARHAAWTASLDVFRELRPNVERAIDWIDRTCAAHDGYLAYESTTGKGLVNQGWKDSGDAIVNPDGTIAEPPIALAEVQGYVYAAKREIAELFERDGDRATFDRLRAEADDLRARFERDFWSDDLGSYVMALGRNGRRCDVMTSNAGQVLLSGIAAPERAREVAKRLLAREMFNGWGIRTMSTGAAAYNPIGYHLGTVWPHDNGLIADGFRRYGLDDEAQKILVGLVEASAEFPQERLPECLAGFDRSELGVPVGYPLACHPQAWAAGSIPHLITTTLGLAPEGFEHRLRLVRPSLPPFVSHVELHGVRIADASVDLSFDRDGQAIRVGVNHVHGDLEVVEGDQEERDVIARRGR